MIDFVKLWEVAWPHLILVIGAFFCLLTAVVRSSRGVRVTTLLALIILSLSAYGFFGFWREGSLVTIDFLVLDPFGNFLGLLICAIALVTLIISHGYWQSQAENIPEAVPLLVFSAAGMALMVATTHLLTFVLALELMSLCLYVMVGMRRGDPQASEASFKYFLLGSVAAAFLLFGVSFLYGATGTLSLSEMGQHFILPGSALIFQAGVLLVLLGFAFKVAAAPLHFWAPDAYQGAPMPVTGFMATGVKVAAFGALIRVLQSFVIWESLDLQKILAGLSVATMVVGNLTALRQKSLKRILAYSSISHAGYLLLGMATLVAGSNFRFGSLSPVLFYLAVYGLLTLGCFAVLTALSSGGKELDDLEDLKGLAHRHPFLAATLSIFLISLAGIPPSAGFLAKYYLFSQAIQWGFYGLAVVGIITSAISLYYYLGPVVRMYFYGFAGEGELPPLGGGVKLLISLMAAAVFYLGLFPGASLNWIKNTQILSSITSDAQPTSPP